jgi:hypothetical protein
MNKIYEWTDLYIVPVVIAIVSPFWRGYEGTPMILRLSVLVILLACLTSAQTIYMMGNGNGMTGIAGGARSNRGYPSRGCDRARASAGVPSMIHTDRHAAIALGAIAVLALLSCCGCGATITVNVLSSHSRYGQSIGGTNTTIKGQIEGGGSATGTLTPIK